MMSSAYSTSFIATNVTHHDNVTCSQTMGENSICSLTSAMLLCSGQCGGIIPDLSLKSMVNTNAGSARVVIESTSTKRWMPPPSALVPSPSPLSDVLLTTATRLQPFSHEFRSVPASGTLGVSFLSLSLVQFQDRWIELQLVVSGGTSYVYGWGGRKGMFKLDNTNGRGYSM